MTDTERYVNLTCERIVASGHARLYRDLYKDLRERLSCGVTCRLIAEGLRRTRLTTARAISGDWRRTGGSRARAVAALTRLDRYDRRKRFREAWKTGDWSNAES